MRISSAAFIEGQLCIIQLVIHRNDCCWYVCGLGGSTVGNIIEGVSDWLSPLMTSNRQFAYLINAYNTPVVPSG